MSYTRFGDLAFNVRFKVLGCALHFCCGAGAGGGGFCGDSEQNHDRAP